MHSQIIHGDCLEVMGFIPDGSVDMILADLPYGTTGVACKNLSRSFIGIEKDETYFKIAKARIEATHVPQSHCF